jgi:hypothetical protein
VKEAGANEQDEALCAGHVKHVHLEAVSALASVVPETYKPFKENIEVELTFLRDDASKFLNGALNDASHHSNQTFGRLYTRTHSVGLQ